MRCLTDEQIEGLLRGPGDAGLARLREHADGCETCRGRLDAARAEAELIADLRELRRRGARTTDAKNE